MAKKNQNVNPNLTENSIASNSSIETTPTAADGKGRISFRKLKSAVSNGFGKAKYPWQEWLNGEPHILRNGKEFVRDTTEQMPPAINTECRKHYKNHLAKKLSTLTNADLAEVKAAFPEFDWNSVNLQNTLLVEAWDMDADERKREDAKRIEETARGERRVELMSALLEAGFEESELKKLSTEKLEVKLDTLADVPAEESAVS